MSKREKIFKVTGEQQPTTSNSSMTNQTAMSGPSSSLDRIGSNLTKNISTSNKQFSVVDEADSGNESRESGRLNASKQTSQAPQEQVQLSEMNEMQQIRFMMQRRDRMKTNNERPSRFQGLAQKRQFQQSNRRSKFFKQDVRADQDNEQNQSDDSAETISNDSQQQKTHMQRMKANESRQHVQKPQIKRRFFSDVGETSSPSASNENIKLPESNKMKSSMYEPTQSDPIQKDLADNSIGIQKSTNQQSQNTNIQNQVQNRRSFNRKISQFGLKNINDDKIRGINQMDVDSSDYYSASQSEDLIGSNRQLSNQQIQRPPSDIDKFNNNIQTSSNNYEIDQIKTYQPQVKDGNKQTESQGHDFYQFQQISISQSSVRTSRDDNKNTIGQLTDSLVSVGREAISQYPNKTLLSFIKDQHGNVKQSQSQILDQQNTRKRARDIETLQRNHYSKIDTNRSNELTGSGSEGLVGDFHIHHFTNTISNLKQTSSLQQDLMGSQKYLHQMRDRKFEQVPQPAYAQQTPPMLSRSTSSNQTAEFGIYNVINQIESHHDKEDASKLISIHDNSSNERIQVHNVQLNQQTKYYNSTNNIYKNQQNSDVDQYDSTINQQSLIQSNLPVESQKRSVYIQQLCQKEQYSPQRYKSQFSKNMVHGRFNYEDEMSDEESSNQEELSDRQGALRRRGSRQSFAIIKDEDMPINRSNQSSKQGQINQSVNPNFNLAENAVVDSQNKQDFVIHHNLQSNYNNDIESGIQQQMNEPFAGSPNKYFDRYVGNIAESDEDYDDESDYRQQKQSKNENQEMTSHDNDNNSISFKQSQIQKPDTLMDINPQTSFQDNSQINDQNIEKTLQILKNTQIDGSNLSFNQRVDSINSIQSSQAQSVINNLISSKEEYIMSNQDNNKIMNDLSQKLEPRLGPLKKDNQINKVSQFSPFCQQLSMNDLQQQKDAVSYNDAGSSLSSDQLSKDAVDKNFNNKLQDEDDDEEDENDEEEYNLPDELIETGKDSLPKTLATTINNQSLNNMMSPSRLIDSSREYQIREQAPRDLMNMYRSHQIVDVNKMPFKQFPQSANNKNSFTTIFSQFKKLGQEDDNSSSQKKAKEASITSNLSRTPQLQANIKFNFHRKNSVCPRVSNELPQDLKQSKESGKFYINFPLIGSSRQQTISQKSQISNHQADVQSNYSQSKKDSYSNDEQRQEQRTYMATLGGSNNQYQAVNACSESLSSMKEQFKNDLTINNSPKALTTNSRQSQDKSLYAKSINRKIFQSSANAKTLNEKLQILHSQSQVTPLQTNLANISNLNQATKGSNTNNSDAKSISNISINFNARDDILSEKNDQHRLSFKGQRPIQQNLNQQVKPNIRFTEKLNQKIIEDNFNYHTEQTEMQSQSYNTLTPEEEMKNLQQYIEKQQSQKELQEKCDESDIPNPQAEQNQSNIDQQLVTIPLNIDLLNNTSIPFYPDFVNNNKNFSEDFTKQFQDIISTKLKKKLTNPPNLKEIQEKLAPLQSQDLRITLEKSQELDTVKRTLILTIDDCLLKTSIFKEELPHVDATFKFKTLKVHVCFRKYLKEFIHEVKKYYEVIAWTSSQLEYSDQLIKIIEDKLDFKFDMSLSIQDQVPSEDQLLYVKNIDILTGTGSRLEKNIILVDSQMSNFTNKLTNGLYLPPIRFSSQSESDMCLKSLLKYLTSFVIEQHDKDVRNMIKVDFDLLNRFNNNKQCLAFQKILRRTVEESSESALVNIGVSGQKQIIQQLRDNSKKTTD